MLDFSDDRTSYESMMWNEMEIDDPACVEEKIDNVDNDKTLNRTAQKR